MPESVVREELESRNICPGSHAPAFRMSWPGPLQGPPSHSPLHFISGARPWGVETAITHRTLRVASVGGIVRGPERPIAMQSLPALWTHAAKLRLRTPMHRVWLLSSFRWLLYSAGTAAGNHKANCRGYVIWKQAKAGLAKQAPHRGRKGAAQATLPLRKTAGRAIYRTDGPGRGVQSRRPRGRVVKVTMPLPLFQIPFSAGHGCFRAT